MAFFKADADPDMQAQKAAEATLRAKRRDRAGLAERLGIAETAVTSYRAQARQLAADGGDDKEITKIESRMRDSADRSVTLSGALADVDGVITGLEAQIDEIIDRRMRAETSIAVNAMAARLEKAQAAHASAALELEMSARECALVVLDGHPCSAFILSAREQLAPAVEVIVVGLRNHARAVLDGRAPASLPRAEVPAPKLGLVPPPEMLTIFALQNLKFTNATGGITTIGKCKKHSLPKALAELALAERVALPLSDPRCRDLEFGAISYLPDESSCVWLGPVGRESPARVMRPGGPVTHSSLTVFEKLDRGPAYSATMARPPEPEAPALLAVGARKAEEE